MKIKNANKKKMLILVIYICYNNWITEISIFIFLGSSEYETTKQPNVYNLIIMSTNKVFFKILVIKIFDFLLITYLQIFHTNSKCKTFSK